MRCYLPTLCLAVVFASGAWAGGVYKWVDEHGRVHYGDRPGGPGARELRVPESAPPDADEASRLERRRHLLRAIEEEREQKRAEAARRKAEKERRARNCAVARDRLRSYRNAGYLYDLDREGRRRVLSDTERARAIADAERAVAYWCGS